ncbi:unnamed protein product [Effrenium voratum]|uniref:PA14 domain-containing protein n=1 Tax=Effrenium voratum TaxID=2562239 RepID=A0AA36IXZ0_9DINO|nr:unnamed protein product [Effrenium voratum]
MGPWVLLLLLGTTAAADCHDGSCRNQGSLFLQKEMLQRVAKLYAEEDVAEMLKEGYILPDSHNRTRERDARFLLSASFGPTRKSLEQLGQVSHGEWLRQQMELPAGSLREFYRARVNPFYEVEVDSKSSFTPRSACAVGSRWRRHVFTLEDQGRKVEVKNGQLLVGGAFRSDVSLGTLGSRWSGFENYTGYICFLEEGLGNDVHISSHSNCPWNVPKSAMPNPAVYLADASQAVHTELPFLPGPSSSVLLQSYSGPCTLEGAEFIHLEGRFYAADPRVELLANTFASPVAKLCTPVTFINEKGCLSPPLPADQPKTAGLTAEVHLLSETPAGFISKTGTLPNFAFLDTQINYASSSSSWRSELPKDKFAIQWRGTLKIQTAGLYTFFLTSDDGSRLELDGVEVVLNGGFHGMEEKSGQVNLTQGGHTLLVEFYEGGGGAGIIFYWQGPDSNDAKEVVPPEVFETTPPKVMECPTCGSPGEVANMPELGHHFRFYTTRDDADNDLDSHFFDRFDTKLSKSTVWTAKALGAEDQLRQRTAWALSQIFVVSANGFGRNERTEVWLNYYDIFVRNAFGNFRDLLREVTYNPLMGSYLTNTGSSSYDYNNRFPNENYAREIMQLFTIGLDMLYPNGTAVRDAQGNVVPTYGMDKIVSFAKVFTGFQERSFRANIENWDNDNLIDPLKMDAGRHDVHPKNDLYGGYLGDGLPLCASASVVSKGARFELYSVAYMGEVLDVLPGSDLYTALCAASGPSCTFPVVVELPEDLSCTGDECTAEVQIVKVDGRFYRFIPPPCVYDYLETTKGSSGSYFPMGKAKCPAGTHIMDYNECEAAVVAVYGSHDGNPNLRNNTWAPKGCSYRTGRMYVNPHPVGRTSGGDYNTICLPHVFVHETGRVSAKNKEPNDFEVQWAGPVPAAGLHLIELKEEAAFSTLPSPAEVLALPGAFRPTSSCTLCEGQVKVFHPQNDGPELTESAVFEVEGRFFHNLRKTVHLGASSFRNPPVFLKGQQGRVAERAALEEVECLLDHLFHHKNTPVFISKRLIQRFGISNPSPSYLEAVQHAFRTGSYESMPFSGVYGDLGAAVAAALLHPQADMEGHTSRQFHGSLREPMLKLIHFMRSMEYMDVSQEFVVFKELQDVLGQFPFQSPTVFNFYLADFNLPEPEPENEVGMTTTTGMPGMPEPEAETLVAPELQIFTPPHFIGFLNGMSSLIKYGVNERCDSVRGFGQRPQSYNGLDWREKCPMGTLHLPDDGEDKVLNELDVLLTGGRLTNVTRAAAAEAYRTAPSAQRLQRAQQAVLLSPEFNTLGDPLPKPEPRAPTVATGPTAQKPYKAAIVLFLAGGADTWNMVVPQNCPIYQEYVDFRTDLHLDPEDLIAINVTGQPCSEFGIHGSFSYLKELYDEKDLAFVTNIGSLVEPLNKQQFRGGLKRRCVGLFSHSDQQTAAQTLECQTEGNSPRGAGGRMTDALVSQEVPVRATSFSVAGSAIFAQGVLTNRQIVSEAGNKRFADFELWREAISNITRQQHANVFSEQYAKVFLDSIETTEELGRAIEDVELATSYSTNSGLQKQLSQVAKLIRVREVRKAERDFFFVQVGGWDMHSNLNNGLVNSFGSINAALRGFVAEMKAQNVWDSVVLASTSEFARTLDSNGGGSDHAWAGQHFVIGGKVKGGQMLNKFPSSLKEGGYNDLGRGRLIPEYPWESMLVPMAEWMGLETTAAVMGEVFPNFGNFNSSVVQGQDFLFEP